MASILRLQEYRDGMEEECDLLGRKLQKLRRAYRIEVDTATKFKLEMQIEEGQEELEELEQELDQIELKINDLKKTNSGSLEKGMDLDRLYGALLKLGYEEQQRPFRRILKEHALAPFLIQGPSSEYGQRWLLNRLAMSISDIIEAKKVKIDFAQVSTRTDISALWRKLSGQVLSGQSKMSTENSNDAIAERVCKWWKTQNVLFIFNNVHATVKENLQDVLHDFWMVLFHKAEELKIQQHEFKLLMFLVDYKGEVSTWDLGVAKKYDTSWQPSMPIELPAISPFSTDKLMTWLEQQSESLPTQLSDDIEDTVQEVLAVTRNGIPEPTFREICRLCGCSWDEQEERWLRL